jgi:hypothetical protein
MMIHMMGRSHRADRLVQALAAASLLVRQVRPAIGIKDNAYLTQLRTRHLLYIRIEIIVHHFLRGLRIMSASPST